MESKQKILEEEILFIGRGRKPGTLRNAKAHNAGITIDKSLYPNPAENHESHLDDYLENLESNQDHLHDIEALVKNGNGLEISTSQENEKMLDDWESTDLADFDQFSTSSDDDAALVRKVHARRERKSGIQYLVTDAGKSVDDARWLRQAVLLDQPQTVKLMAHFDRRNDNQNRSLHTNSNAKDLSLEDPTSKSTPIRTSHQQRKERSNVQQSLDEDDFEDDDITMPKHNQATFFGAASFSLDLDLLDGLELDTSDAEFEAQIQAAWRKDKQKKKERKQHREELRKQGLLGKRTSGTTKIKAKYPEGITTKQIKAEIEAFLVSSNQTLALPPMNPTSRKKVHEIGHQLGMKTKSQGRANERYPTMTKTARTATLDQVSSAFASGNKLRKHAAKSHFSRLPGQSRGAPSAGVTYRDGEIVGASAPEIDSDNRGRALLERMGWSAGTALGANNNKGMTIPVAQVIKTTKAGLG